MAYEICNRQSSLFCHVYAYYIFLGDCIFRQNIIYLHCLSTKHKTFKTEYYVMVRYLATVFGIIICARTYILQNGSLIVTSSISYNTYKRNMRNLNVNPRKSYIIGPVADVREEVRGIYPTHDLFFQYL